MVKSLGKQLTFLFLTNNHFIDSETSLH